MAKAWDIHQAELIQLYVTEGRTLKEVQEVLRRRHGFNASTRAYRMKIDEWGLRKYNSSKTKSTPIQVLEQSNVAKRTTASSAPKILPTPRLDETDDVLLMFGSLSIPTGPMDCANLLRLLEGHECHALEVLLLKWQPGGEYLEAALDVLRNESYSLQHLKLPDLFVQAANIVPSGECFVLTKAFLKADLNVRWDTYDFNPPFWVNRFRLAAGEADWEAAKDALAYVYLLDQAPGKLFADCAFIVVAERILVHHRTLFESPGRPGNTPISSTQSNAEYYCQQCIEVFKDADVLGLDLDPSFLRFFVQITSWNHKLTKRIRESDRVEIERLARDNNKCREIISFYTGKGRDEIDGSLDALSDEANATTVHEQENWLFFNHTSVPPLIPNENRRLPDMAGGSYDYQSHQQVDTVAFLYNEWKAGRIWPNVHMQRCLANADWIAALFGSSSGKDSIFDLIVQKVPPAEQGLLTEDILLECSKSMPHLVPASFLFFAWRAVVMEQNWIKFKHLLGTLHDLHLKSSMTPNAANWFSTQPSR